MTREAISARIRFAKERNSYRKKKNDAVLVEITSNKYGILGNV